MDYIKGLNLREYVSKNGSVTSSTSMAYTDYIPVKPGYVLRTFFTKQGTFTQKSPRFVCCYDQSKAAISSAKAFMEQKYPGFSNAVVREEMYTPRTFTRFTSRLNGAIYGIENKRNFMDDLRSKNLLSDYGTVGGKTVRNVITGYSF